MVDPALMCSKHLLGEHGELHKFLHNWRKQHRVDGRIDGNAMEPMSYQARHDCLAAEMLARGMNHQSEIYQPDFSYLSDAQRLYQVDQQANLTLLQSRCNICADRGALQQHSMYNRR
jgi:hypothetical protein